MNTGALQRVVRRAGERRAAATERCDLCGVPTEDGHRHLFDSARRQVLCACRACSLLFGRDAASRGHYRLIPQRRVRLEPVPTKETGVPVGLAFFVPRADGTASAHYPSPAGPTRWEVEAADWSRVVAACAELGTLSADVEALLVNTAHGRRHHWIVPLDDCFRLAAIVRREWRGLSGGSRVWPAVERFFEELTERE